MSTETTARLPRPLQTKLRDLAIAVERLRGTLTTSELGTAIDAMTDLADHVRDVAIDELGQRQVVDAAAVSAAPREVRS